MTSADKLKMQALEALQRGALGKTPGHLLDRILQRGVFVEFSDHSPISQPDDPVRIAVILSGRLRIYYEHEDGRQLTVCRLSSGNLAGLVAFASQKSPLCAAAEGGLKLWMIPKDNLEELLEKFPQAYAGLLSELGMQFDKVIREWIAFAFSSVEDRLLRYFAQATGETGSVRISQQALADEIGTVREVVTRALGRLKDAGKLVSDSSGFRLPSV